jgi:uncharacterized protein (TIGR00297 family)
MVTTKDKEFTEIGRKVLHISMVIFAFLLRYLSWEAAMLCAVAAFLHNLFILPRLTSKFYREGSPRDIGIIFYPVSVFFVILFFPNHMYLAAALWAIMSFGDGFATIFGIKYGKKKLPWSKDKSWVGSITYVITASAGASLLIWWTKQGQPENGDSALFLYLILPVILSFISAIFESLPFGVNDNLLVPMVGAFFGYIILLIKKAWGVYHWSYLADNLLMALIVSFVLGFVSFLLKLVSMKGFIAGFFAGALLYLFVGWRGFVLLATFFIVASALTKLGYKKKQAKGLAQEDKGARGIKHVIANLSLAIILAIVWFLSDFNLIVAIAFTASLATALSDTSSTEIGQLFGRKTFLITTFKKVKPGTDGAVSVEGTMAGLIGAALIAAVAFLIGFFDGDGTGLTVSAISIAIIVAVAGFLGNLVESYMNAFVKKKAEADNELMNLLNTIAGAGLAIILYNLMLVQ